MAIGSEMANVTVGRYHCCHKYLSIVLNGQYGAVYKWCYLKIRGLLRRRERFFLVRTVILGNIFRNC